MDRDGFLQQLRRAGIAGGLLISLPPAAFPAVGPSAGPLERIQNLKSWCGTSGNLYPFYWLDPMEADALDQIGMAVAQGVMGFKVICDRYFPGNPRALEIFAAIARARKPILFHSGILWDAKPSSRYNRPAEFEALLEVSGLRFCLAHISWPWCDELIAVYGKFLNAQTCDADAGAEMYVDITPGTPPVYRRQALVNLFSAGYDVEHHVMFGTDSCAHAYNAAWAREWIDRDKSIFAELGLPQKTLDAIYADNLKRFVGISTDCIHRKAPLPGI